MSVRDRTNPTAGPATLAAVADGGHLRVTGVGSGSDRLRLAELGLRTGAVITVVHRTAGGGRLLALRGGDRLAVDRSTAERVTGESL